MFLRRLKFFLVATVLIIGGFFYLSNVYSSDQDITVGMTVPASGGTGGPDPDPDNPPIISNVSTSTSYTTASITWSASDDKGVIAASLQYGLTNTYGLNGNISGTYQVSLSGLTTNTLYYYKITVTDSGSQTANYAGTLRTLATAPLQDTTPPIISNVQVSVNITTATVSWQTNELANSQVNYGLNNSYGNTVSILSNYVLSHKLLLTSLLPNITYHYQIVSTDNSSNSSNSSNATFITLKDNVVPPNVTELNLITTTNSISLTWKNPSLVVEPDFAGVKILRKIGLHSSSNTDGTVVYTGKGQSFTDSGVVVNTNYYYTIFSFDTSNNFSTGVYDNTSIVVAQPPTNEICDNNKDDDGDGNIDCADSDCSVHPSCNIISPPVPENCSNGIDDDGDGKIDCTDGDCSTDPSCVTPPSPISENCSNKIDDDNDGLIDCQDGDCSGFSGCQGVDPGPGPGPGGTTLACQDGKDNDNDGKIDYPSDPGCKSSNDNDEYNPPQSTVPEYAKLKLPDLSFLVGNNLIKLLPVNAIINGLSGDSLTISVDSKDLSAVPQTIFLKTNNNNKHQLSLDSTKGIYYTSLSFPSLTEQQVYLEIDYGSNQFDSLDFKLKGAAYGDIFGDKKKRLSGTNVILYQKGGQKISMSLYGQSNPFTTNINGNYGWMVPNGQYYLAVNKNGYYDFKSAIFTISDNIINKPLNLIIKPAKLKDVIDPNVSLATNIKNVTKNLGQQTKALTQRTVQTTREAIKDTARVVQEISDDPKVEETVEKVIAPAVVSVIAVGILPFIVWADFLPLLQLFFLQPLMMFGRRRRGEWGVIYNSLNKLPIDLAIIRLVNITNNKVIQSRVTDRQGRYLFIANPGKYRLQVKKAGYIFPTKLLSEYKSDGQKIDIYHAENISVSEKNAVITANIPLDPVGQHKKPHRLIWTKIGRAAQTGLALTGIFITAISLYISPKWYIALLLVVHISLFLVFRRLSKPIAKKSWGIVYDKSTKKPLGKVIARLFHTKFNKLVATQITDNKGRYNFLAGDESYYVTYQHKEYNPEKANVDLRGRRSDTVSIDVGLKRK